MLSFISGIEKLVCILVLNMHIHIKIILPNLNNQKILSFILHVARDLVIIVYVYKNPLFLVLCIHFLFVYTLICIFDKSPLIQNENNIR